MGQSARPSGRPRVVPSCRSCPSGPMRPSGLNAMASTESSWVRGLPIGAPVLAFQSRAV